MIEKAVWLAEKGLHCIQNTGKNKILVFDWLKKQCNVQSIEKKNLVSEKWKKMLQKLGDFYLHRLV